MISRRKVLTAVLPMLCTLALTSPVLTVYADEAHSGVAGSKEMASTKNVMKYGMTPIAGEFIADGTYDIDVDSSSKFFRIENAELTVKNGKMTAALTMSSYSYSLLYLGTAEEAAKAPASDYYEYKEVDDWYVFTIPVDALNEAISCASYSTNRDKWYNREILFDASSLPEDAVDFDLPDYDKIEEALSSSSSSKNSSETSSEDTAVNADNETLSTSQQGNRSVSNSQDENSSDSTGSANPAFQNAAASKEVQDKEAQNKEVQDKEAQDKEIQEYIDKYDLDPKDEALISTDPITIEGMKDGEYSIALDMAGGSGRSSLSSPTMLTIRDGKAYARILWSSSNYDWMIVGGKVYLNETTDGGNSSFTIPISGLDENIPIIADTTAMGDPVPIDYTLAFYEDSIGSKGQIPQEAAKKVIIVAVIIIIGGFFLNMFVKRRQK